MYYEEQEMKIYIGNYPNRLTCRVHTRYMDRKYGYVDWPEPEQQTRFQRSLELFENAVQSVYNVFNWIWYDRRKQKVKVRIDRQDTWSMDHTLALIILPMLKQLKETKHGAPNVDLKDVPKELHPKKQDVLRYKEVGDTDDKFFERWDWIMDEMIWAFEQKCRDHWEEDYYEYREAGPEETKDPGSLFGLKLVWEDPEGRKAHQERMSNGFRLFGKYYESLWD